MFGARMLRKFNFKLKKVQQQDYVPKFHRSCVRFILHFMKPKFFLFLVLSINYIIQAHSTMLYSTVLQRILIQISAETSRDWYTVIPYLSKYSVVAIILSISYAMSCFLSAYLVPWFVSNIRAYFFSSLLNNSYFYFLHTPIGNTISRVTSITSSGIRIMQYIYSECIPTLSLILTTTIVLFNYKAVLRNVILIWGLMHIGIYLLRLPNYMFLSSANAKIFVNLNGVMGDIIKNILNIRILNSKKFEENYFNLKQEVDIKSYRRALSYDKTTCASMDLFAYLPILNTLFIYKILQLCLLKELSMGEALVIFNIARSVATQIWRTTTVIADILVDINRFQEALQVLNLPNQVLDQFPNNPITTDGFHGSVEFIDVNFFYQKNESLLFDSLNLKIQGRTKVALVGSSGSGKSTVISLLMRINEAIKGKILVNEQDIKSVSRSSISKVIAFVSQSSFLFERTIFENIGYGSEEFREFIFNKTNRNLKFYNLPQYLQVGIIEAAKKAEAHAFILNLSDGYDTRYGNETNLSGGQIQRLNIARAFINKDAQILVLDEATSALDSESDVLIKKILDKMNITIIMVAHKLNLIKDFDRILVFNEGKIIEDGSHEELIRLGGKYHTLSSSFER